jgi:hypothetical protein
VARLTESNGVLTQSNRSLTESVDKMRYGLVDTARHVIGCCVTQD